MLDQLIAFAVPTAVLVAFLAGAPASGSRRRREAAARRRRVSRHPALATLGDVQCRLDRELPGRQVDFVLARAGEHRIDAHTLWAWLDRHGAEALVLALASGLGYAGLLRILREERPFDPAEARLLAHLGEPALFDLAWV